MTDQEHLEKAYYWNEDEQFGAVHKLNFVGPVESIGNYKRGNKRPKNRIPKGLKEQKHVSKNYTTGWHGIENYIKQCQISENRNWSIDTLPLGYGSVIADRKKDMLEVQQFTPKKVPFKCPVCSGFGTVKYGQLICTACDGKGYVVVDQEEREIDNGKPTDWKRLHKNS